MNFSAMAIDINKKGSGGQQTEKWEFLKFTAKLLKNGVTDAKAN